MMCTPAHQIAHTARAPDSGLARTCTLCLVALLAVAIQALAAAGTGALLLLLASLSLAMLLMFHVLVHIRSSAHAASNNPSQSAQARQLASSASKLLQPLASQVWGSECVVLQLVDCEIRRHHAQQAAEGAVSPLTAHASSRRITSTEMEDMSVMHHLNLSSEFAAQMQRCSPWLDADMVQRFMDACRGDEHKALQRIKATVDWRLANKIDSMLERPHPYFDVFKKAYRHGVHCRAKDGQPVYIEVVGGFKAAYQAFKDAGAPEDAGIMHSVYVNEWMFKDTCTDKLPRGKCYKIADVKGLSLSDFRHPAMNFARQSGAVVQDNYVERLEIAVVLNVPAWFSIAWKIACSLMDERTTARFRICGSIQEARETLLTFMHEEDIPVEYGGTCTRDLYDSPDEVKMRSHVHTINVQGTNKEQS